jgi:hypothetical protein
LPCNIIKKSIKHFDVNLPTCFILLPCLVKIKTDK